MSFLRNASSPLLRRPVAVARVARPPHRSRRSRSRTSGARPSAWSFTAASSGDVGRGRQARRVKEGEGRVLLDPVDAPAAASAEPAPRVAADARRPPRRARRRAREKLEYEASPDGKLAAWVRKDPALEGGGEPRRRGRRGRQRVAGHAGQGRRDVRPPRLGLPGGGLRPRQLQGLLVEPGLEVHRVPRPRRGRRQGLHGRRPRPGDRSTRTRPSRSRSTKYPKAGDPNPTRRARRRRRGRRRRRSSSTSRATGRGHPDRRASRWDPDGNADRPDPEPRSRTGSTSSRVDPADGEAHELLRETIEGLGRRHRPAASG